MKAEKKQTMPTCTRILEFDAGHRIVKHESKCRNFHGHRYKMEATFEANNLDHLGRVVDFGVIKTILGKWIDDNLDHTMILNEEDKKYGKVLEQAGNKPIYYVEFNPTAENLAKMLFEKANQLLKTSNLKATNVRLWETPNCYSDYKG